LISAATAAVAQTGFGSATWQDFGFDYLITTGLATINTFNYFKVYPNPTSDKININNLQLKNNGIISIYDLFGKSVYSQVQNKLNTSATIDMSNFEQGVYTITQ